LALLGGDGDDCHRRRVLCVSESDRFARSSPRIADLFYLNRVLGSLLGALLRWFLLWKQNVYFEVESIQFSPLGGRISFRDLRYYSRNQSLRVMSGDITFRYWFWHVRDDNDESTSEREPEPSLRARQR
jgi:hypothetical protein